MSQLSLEKSRESDCLLLNASPAVAQSHLSEEPDREKLEGVLIPIREQ